MRAFQEMKDNPDAKIKDIAETNGLAQKTL
jgi:hypothetical protein